jgi:hypothetical protein
MGRKIIFDLADIKRHCSSSSCVSQVFTGNLKEKIKLDDRGKTQNKVTGSSKAKCPVRKRKGKEPKKGKKKRRVSSGSSEDASSDQESKTIAGSNGFVNFSDKSEEQRKDSEIGGQGSGNRVGDSEDSAEQSDSSGTESSSESSSEEDSS